MGKGILSLGCPGQLWLAVEGRRGGIGLMCQLHQHPGLWLDNVVLYIQHPCGPAAKVIAGDSHMWLKVFSSFFSDFKDT